MQMRTLQSGTHAFVLVLSSFDFINVHCSPFQGRFGDGGLCSIIQPIFTLVVEGQSNFFLGKLAVSGSYKYFSSSFCQQ